MLSCVALYVDTGQDGGIAFSRGSVLPWSPIFSSVRYSFKMLPATSLVSLFVGS